MKYFLPSIKKLIFQRTDEVEAGMTFLMDILRLYYVHYELFLWIFSRPWTIFTRKWWWIECAAFNFSDWTFFPLKSSLSCLIIIGNKIWNDDNKFSVTSKPSTTLKTANFGKMCSWGNKQNLEIHKTLFLPSMALYELIITVIKCSHGVRMLEVFLTAHENLKCCKFYLLEPTHNP